MKSIPAEDSVSKAKRAAELQAQIQARLKGLSGALPPPLIPGLQGQHGQSNVSKPPAAAAQPLAGSVRRPACTLSSLNE